MDAAANQHAWTLDGAIAAIRHGRLATRIDVARPELGLQQIQVADRPLSTELLCISREDERPAWQLPVADAYVRGNDLVASYQPTNDWPYSPQIYWRAAALEEVSGVIASLSLLVSVQTHLLDTWPRITLNSQLRCDEVLQVHPETGMSEKLNADQTVSAATGHCCVLRRLADVPLSYVELMPSNDFRELTVSRHDNGVCLLKWRVVADFLEKGVIRRARMQTAFIPRENDVDLAVACWQAMERRPLPLTT